MTTMIRLPFLTVLILLCMLTPAHAQESGNDLEEIPVQKQLLPYTNPINAVEEGVEVQVMEENPVQEVDFQDVNILEHIARVYRTYLMAIDSQVNEDPASAEEYINEAVADVQSLMEIQPQVRESPRFVELYRSVITEYREFYNITGPINPVEGDIFEVQEEIFSDLEELELEEFEFPERVNFEQTDVPLVQNRQVSRHLIYYTVRRPEVMDRWLQRSEKYFPMMREIFREEGVPEELIHLSMIESGLTPTARSWASAVGLWQFIRPTGAMYGLEVNWWIDERRDPVKSTRAAARHLRDLYNIWEDWHLAMANYNISPRGLRRAINAAGGEKDYWSAYPYLPRETRGYVPGFIAATMVAMNPEAFGFQRTYNVERWSYDVVEVAGLMPLDRLAEAAGLTTNELKEYNPELLRWATPPGDRYPLKIPTGIREEFLAAYEQIPEEERVDEVAVHTVSRGENLGQIANRYGTSVRALFATNENLNTTIHPGQRIIVPVAGGSMEPISADRPTNSPRSAPSARSQQRAQAAAPPNTSPVQYTVKQGDTVGHIAEWFDVLAWQIRGWNGIGNVIRAGQQLTVHVPNNRVNFYTGLNDLSFGEKQELQRRQRRGENIYNTSLVSSSQEGGGSSSVSTTTYTVRRNDTLTGIASRFNVSVADIQRLNNLRGTRIYPGQTLEIRTNQ